MSPKPRNVMAKLPEDVAEFLRGKRFVVAGVSRSPHQAANAIFKKLRGSGYEVFPVNPNADEVEGERCYRDLATVPGPIDGVVLACPPAAALDVVRACARLGVRQVWFHRSFGHGSVSDAAVAEGRALGLTCIVGGCPLMFCEPVDFGHRCVRWFLQWRGTVPA